MCGVEVKHEGGKTNKLHPTNQTRDPSFLDRTSANISSPAVMIVNV